MEKYTFESLGFRDVKAVMKPNKLEGYVIYNTVGISHPEENIRRFLTASLIDYVKENNKEKPDSFMAGVAYMMDGTAYLVYNGAGMQRGKLFSTHITKKECRFRSIQKYIAKFINRNHPEAILLIQEVEPRKDNEYQFRIVHEKDSDREYGNILQFPQKKS